MRTIGKIIAGIFILVGAVSFLCVVAAAFVAPSNSVAKTREHSTSVPYPTAVVAPTSTNVPELTCSDFDAAFREWNAGEDIDYLIGREVKSIPVDILLGTRDMSFVTAEMCGTEYNTVILINGSLPFMEAAFNHKIGTVLITGVIVEGRRNNMITIDVDLVEIE